MVVVGLLIWNRWGLVLGHIGFGLIAFLGIVNPDRSKWTLTDFTTMIKCIGFGYFSMVVVLWSQSSKKCPPSQDRIKW